MSANARGRISGVTPRVVRIRNRCVQTIARRRSLPVPTRADLEKLGDGLSLVDAIAQWEAAHQPAKPKPRGGFELPARPRARWQSPVFMKSAAVAFAALVGIVAGRQLLPRAAAQSSDGIVEQPWLAVTDSVSKGVSNTIYRVSDENRRMVLTAADVAALIFRSPRRHTVFVDSIEARADSLLSIRGRLAGNATIELRGELQFVRRGVAELVVDSLMVDGTEVEPTMISRLVARGRARSEKSNHVRFDIPLDVTGIAISNGLMAMTRDRYAPNARSRVVR
jgi:hypothetical protein